ncbi:histone H2A [Echinococcus multilocularis]|uniref:Histone H2A n=1 Tax=Echinococcus multilocularis TaxID=6211 RepID=A0A068Y3F3_ECHMU|nr:histone H2A [Echinococcus multilocularis]
MLWLCDTPWVVLFHFEERDEGPASPTLHLQYVCRIMDIYRWLTMVKAVCRDRGITADRIHSTVDADVQSTTIHTLAHFVSTLCSPCILQPQSPLTLHLHASHNGVRPAVARGSLTPCACWSTSLVYLAAVLEYLAVEVLELVGITACDSKKTSIIIRPQLQLAIRNDEELNKLLRGATMMEGGGLLNIQAVLVLKKTEKSVASKELVGRVA